MPWQKGSANHKYKHGMTDTPEYKVWNNMYSRCLNKNHPRYKDWGGRGITIDKKWLKFEGFYEDMGDRPGGNYTLERKDNSLGYSKDNCYWATTREQAINRRSNRILTANGYKFTMIEWSEKLNINPVTLSSRLRRGWSVEEALAGKRNV